MRNSVCSILLVGLLAVLAVACNTNGKTPMKIDVGKEVVVEIYSVADSGGVIGIIPPSLLEETVYVSELLYYPDDDVITMPFIFSNTKEYERITERHIDKRIAISVNGQVVSTPVVRMKIQEGACSVVLDESQAAALFPEVKIEELKSDCR